MPIVDKCEVPTLFESIVFDVSILPLLSLRLDLIFIWFKVLLGGLLGYELYYNIILTNLNSTLAICLNGYPFFFFWVDYFMLPKLIWSNLLTDWYFLATYVRLDWLLLHWGLSVLGRGVRTDPIATHLDPACAQTIPLFC